MGENVRPSPHWTTSTAGIPWHEAEPDWSSGGDQHLISAWLNRMACSSAKGNSFRRHSLASATPPQGKGGGLQDQVAAPRAVALRGSSVFVCMGYTCKTDPERARAIADKFSIIFDARFRTCRWRSARQWRLVTTLRPVAAMVHIDLLLVVHAAGQAWALRTTWFQPGARCYSIAAARSSRTLPPSGVGMGMQRTTARVSSSTAAPVQAHSATCDAVATVMHCQPLQGNTQRLPTI